MKQRQEVWSFDAYEQSFILVRVQKTRHSYESQWESQVKIHYICLRMGTAQGPL
jgi:hypothetical protein